MGGTLIYLMDPLEHITIYAHIHDGSPLDSQGNEKTIVLCTEDKPKELLVVPEGVFYNIQLNTIQDVIENLKEKGRIEVKGILWMGHGLHKHDHDTTTLKSLAFTSSSNIDVFPVKARRRRLTNQSLIDRFVYESIRCQQ